MDHAGPKLEPGIIKLAIFFDGRPDAVLDL